MNSTTQSKNPSRAIVVILTALIAVVVCGFIVSKRVWVHRNVHEPLQRRAAEMTAALKSSGTKVGEPQVADNVNGVEQVFVLEVDGKPIRLLEFDLSKDAEAKEVQHVHQDHATKVLGADQPAEDEGVIVIIDFENHPDKEKILEAFHKTGASGK